MTSGQMRVLVLMGVLFNVELVLNPTFRDNAWKAAQGKLDYHAYLAGLIGWLVGGLALVALASPAPKVATWIVVLFIATAVLTHPETLVTVTNAATAGIGQLTGQQTAQNTQNAPKSAQGK